MKCPKCGTEEISNTCQSCGSQIHPDGELKTDPNSDTSPPSMVTYQQLISPVHRIPDIQKSKSAKLSFYQDKSIIGLILLLLSPILWHFVSVILGLALGFLGLILGYIAYKKQKMSRIDVLTLIFGIIILTVELNLSMMFWGSLG